MTSFSFFLCLCPRGRGVVSPSLPLGRNGQILQKYFHAGGVTGRDDRSSGRSRTVQIIHLSVESSGVPQVGPVHLILHPRENGIFLFVHLETARDHRSPHHRGMQAFLRLTARARTDKDRRKRRILERKQRGRVPIRVKEPHQALDMLRSNAFHKYEIEGREHKGERKVPSHSPKTGGGIAIFLGTSARHGREHHRSLRRVCPFLFFLFSR